MVRKLAIAALVLFGLAMIVVGVQRWLDKRAVVATVQSFIAAVQRGDREQVLAAYGPKERAAIETRLQAQRDSGESWIPLGGPTHRIHRVEIDGDRALAELWIEKEGFALKPLVHLRRSPTRHWKIHDIENLQIDPLWIDAQHAHVRREGEALAGELEQVLDGAAGASVERQPIEQPLR